MSDICICDSLRECLLTEQRYGDELKARAKAAEEQCAQHVRLREQQLEYVLRLQRDLEVLRLSADADGRKLDAAEERAAAAEALLREWKADPGLTLLNYQQFKARIDALLAGGGKEGSDG